MDVGRRLVARVGSEIPAPYDEVIHHARLTAAAGHGSGWHIGHQ